MADDPEVDYYAVVGVTETADAQEIRTAYRKASLAVHPDRNPGDQAAADKFHALTIAFEFLSDPVRRAKLDADRASKAARAARFAGLDNKRKAMAEDLAFREGEYKRRRAEEMGMKGEKERKLEEIKAAGARMRKAREEAAMAAAPPPAEVPIPEPPKRAFVPTPVEELDDAGATVRLKWSKKKEPSLTTPSRLTARLVASGLVEEGDVESLVMAKSVDDPSSKKAAAVVLLRRRRVGEDFVRWAGKEGNGWHDISVSLVDA